MAISDVATFAHLSDADVEALGREFDAIRQDIEESRGADDAAYIARVISTQRRLMVAARLTLFASGFPPAWVAGTAMLAAGKILENMEIGHNVMHGQWDWMNDPEIHSGTWEWDNTCPADQWKHSHNFVHHTFTNVLGKDNDVGYGILRVTSDQKWHPVNLGQPVYNALLALLFEWGVALHDLDIDGHPQAREGSARAQAPAQGDLAQGARQVGKDYLIFPALSGPNFLTTLSANVTANLVRNLWSYMIIFCGHFPGRRREVHRGGARGRDARPSGTCASSSAQPTSRAAGSCTSWPGAWATRSSTTSSPTCPATATPRSPSASERCARSTTSPTRPGPLYRQYGQTLRTIFRLSFPTQVDQPRARFTEAPKGNP